jgi:tetratricopeptide (TPR) repeat protein
MRLALHAIPFAAALASLAQTTVSSAEEKGATTAPAAAADATANGLRRDPKGLQGISPAWEAMAKGDAKLASRDLDGAIADYRDAARKNPESALPQYRLAEAQKLKGDLKEAEAAYNNALRLAGNDATLKGKILFCLADLAERQKEYDAASERWGGYEAFAKGAEKAKLYPASASERKKRLQDWKQNASDSAAVKARIEKRLKEAEETARKNAGK